MKLTLLWLKIKFNKTNNGTSSKFKFFKFRLDMFPQLKSPQSEVRCRVYEIPKMFSRRCNIREGEGVSGVPQGDSTWATVIAHLYK